MDPLSPFDRSVLEGVAAERGRDASTLRELAVRLHDHADAVPGVDELVMEWRRFLPYEPLVARTDDAFVLAVAPSVWAEFGEQVGLTEAELAALRALHDRQARRTAGDRAVFDERAALVLAR